MHFFKSLCSFLFIYLFFVDFPFLLWKDAPIYLIDLPAREYRGRPISVVMGGSGSGTPRIPGGDGTRRDFILGQHDHHRKCMSLSWIAKKYIVILFIFSPIIFLIWFFCIYFYICANLLETKTNLKQYVT